MTPLTAEYRAAREAEHEAGRHADPAFVATTDRYIVGNAYVVGCPLCEAEDEALEAEHEGELEPIEGEIVAEPEPEPAGDTAAKAQRDYMRGLITDAERLERVRAIL